MATDDPTSPTPKAPRQLLVALIVLALGASLVGCTAAASPSPAAAGAEPSASTPTGSTESGRGERSDRARAGFVGPITVTRISGSNVSLSTADGWSRTITVTAETEIRRGGQPIAVADLRVGDEVRLRQRKLDDGSYQVTGISVTVPVIHGTVTAVGPTSLTLERRGGASETVTLTTLTVYRLGDEAATKADVQVGGVVTVAGTRAADGEFTALTVRIRLDRVAGTVASKTATSMVLTRRDGSSVTVRLDATTDVHVRGVEAPTLADIEVGMRAAAVGIRRDDGSLDAVGVIARQPMQRTGAGPDASPGGSPSPTAGG